MQYTKFGLSDDNLEIEKRSPHEIGKRQQALQNCVQLVTLVMNYIFYSAAKGFTNHEQVFLTICIKNFLMQNSLMILENLCSCQKMRIKL